MACTHTTPITLFLLTPLIVACGQPGQIAVPTESGAAAAEGTLVINEIMTAGEGPDWIELHNPGAADVDLAFWQLGHDPADAQPLFAGTSVPAGGHLRLWADGQPDLGPEHLDLQLSVDGETLALIDPSGAVADTLTWGPLLPEHSLARTPDASLDWTVRDQPTPEQPNGGVAAPGSVHQQWCVPTLTMDPPFPVEGETLSLAASCPDGDWTATWVGVDVTGNAPTWTPGLDEGGPRDVLVAMKPTGTIGVPATAVTHLSVADAWNANGNVPVDPETYTEEWGLPVLHIESAQVIGELYIPASFWFQGTQYDGQIKIRGAASAGYPKHNFTLEFDPVQIDLAGVGLQNKDHLVLISNFDDNSHARQRLVYDSWMQMAEGRQRLTPRSFHLVVYAQGEYQGLFVGIDHVDDEFIREMGLASGSNLYKSVNHDANFYLRLNSGSAKSDLASGWEKKEGLPLADFSDIEALTAWAGNATHAEFAADAEDWIPLDEYQDWFALVHHLAADDSAAKNAYLYNQPSDGRFRYVPWDFNHALGQTWQTARQSPASWNDFTWTNAMFWHMQSDPGLQADLDARLVELRADGGALSVSWMHGRLDEIYADIDPSAQRDWERWRDEYTSYGGWAWRTDWTSYEEEKAYLYDWISDRAVGAP